MRTTMVLMLAFTVGCDDGGVSFKGTNRTIPTNGTGTTSGAGICDERDTIWLCTAYVGSDWDDVSAEADCAGEYISGGTCAATPIGTCRSAPATATEVRVSYYEPGYLQGDEAFLSTDCEAAGGVWL